MFPLSRLLSLPVYSSLMAAIPLSPRSAPHLSQGLASAQSTEVRLIGSGPNSATLQVCPAVIIGCFFRKWHATPAPVMAATRNDKPHWWWYRKERRRKFLSFKHPPSMPSQLYILGLVRPSAPQEYRSTMRLGCKSVSGCPAPLFPSLSFSSSVQNAATALSCNGTLSIFPRLTYRFAECEKNSD